MLEERPIAEELLAAGIENGRQEARWMVEASRGSGERIRGWLRRRKAGEPLQYILGDVEFYGLRLVVGPGVLIPRPETEQLVELVLRATAAKPLRVCDLCTGSGAIALALAKERPDWSIAAVDISPDALEYARRNLDMHGLSNVTLLQGDLMDVFQEEERFDVIVSNPPYVSEGEYAELDATVRDWEPRLALEAGPDGLDILRRIAREGAAHLAGGGGVFCEIGETQGMAVAELFAAEGYSSCDIFRDYAGKERFLLAQALVDSIPSVHPLSHLFPLE
jgi:release factor glutamine methyltransferase